MKFSEGDIIYAPYGGTARGENGRVYGNKYKQACIEEIDRKNQRAWVNFNTHEFENRYKIVSTKLILKEPTELEGYGGVDLI